MKTSLPLTLLLCSLCQAQSLPDQKDVGVILNIGPTSGGILMDCHYMNYWNGVQAEEAHFCYSPIPTEYQPVTAMLDGSPLSLTFPHPCTADETNQNFGQGAVIPLAYCKDANNHIPMCKPDSRPDEVCWEPRAEE